MCAKVCDDVEHHVIKFCCVCRNVVRTFHANEKFVHIIVCGAKVSLETFGHVHICQNVHI